MQFTINAGLGGNIVIESAVHLANRLQALLAHTPHPSPVEITALYKDFESVQRPRAHQALGISASATRIEAHATWLYKLASRYVLPLLGDSVKVSYFEGVGVSSPDVEYIPKKAGRLRDLKAERDRKRRKTSGVVQLVKVAAAASLFGWVLEQYGGAYRLAPAMKAIQSLIGRS